MGLYDEIFSRGDPINSEKEYSVTTGTVKENWDKDHPGMVKVEFFFGEQGKNVTGWVPVMTSYAGNGYGSYMLPEVGDTVVIAFERGDRNCPIVIGSIWGKVNALPAETAVEKNNIKRFLTKGGCQVIFDDEDSKNKIEITTPKKMKVAIEDEKETITVSDDSGDNGLSIDCKGGTLKISASKKIEISVGGNPSITMDGSAKSVEVKGNKIDLNGSQALNAKGSNTQITGSMLTVKGDSTVSVESSGMMQVKGAMIKLN